MGNPSRIPYPGLDNGCPGPNDLRRANSAGLSHAADVELHKLGTASGDSVLQRALKGVSSGDAQYDGAELWLFSGFHTSEDEKEHATFRLFKDVREKP